MKTLFTAIISICSSLSLLSQDPGEDLIPWSSTQKLTWADYKASPNPASDAAATTTSYLIFSYSISENNFRYSIASKFSRTRSWGLHKTVYILSHEQGHFDISEIYARKFHQKLKEYRFNPRTYAKDLKKIYQEILEEKDKMQQEYDRETNHSINREKQAEWMQKIARLLDEYRAYADYQNNP